MAQINKSAIYNDIVLKFLAIFMRGFSRLRQARPVGYKVNIWVRLRCHRRGLRIRSVAISILATVAIWVCVQLFGHHIFITEEEMARSKFSTWNWTSSGQKCVHPNLDTDSRVLKEFYSEPRPIECHPADWVYIEKGHIYYNFTVLEKLNIDKDQLECIFKEIRWADDFHNKITDPKKFQSGDLVTHDFLLVKCHYKPRGIFGAFHTRMDYTNIFATIAKNPREFDKTKPAEVSRNALGLNIFIIGFDSVSRVAWKRMMRKSLKYFQETLQGKILDGYNIVGDGTPAALTPILTGKTEPELPHTDRKFKDWKYVDEVYPMIWKEFADSGYVTMWSEDGPNVGTYTYRMNGFKNQPTHHYMRPFHLEAYNNYFDANPPFCLGAQQRHKIVLNYAESFVKTYKHKKTFSFAFHNELSHDADRMNYMYLADNDVLKLLENLKVGGHLHNTMLLMFSDHGQRYSKIRATSQGRLEERMPMFAMYLPDTFKEKHPHLYSNFVNNTKRLTTPFDIHETLRDILDLKKEDGKSRGERLSRGLSLFREIPKERSCKDASIDDHWCACLNWESVSTDDIHVVKSAQILVGYMNELNLNETHLCALLSLDVIQEAQLLKPNDELLKAQYWMNIRFFPLKPEPVSVAYQITIRTLPNLALYEATVYYQPKSGDNYNVDFSTISRINPYGSQPHCIEKYIQNLRKYCYCSQQI